jgi:hypothetical protein
MTQARRLQHEYGVINKEYAAHLATRPLEDDGPIFMVNLMKYHPVAQYREGEGVGKPISGREADERYNPVSILAKIGAAIMFVGEVVSNHLDGDDWDRVAIVRYPTRKSFMDMQRRDDFGEKHVHKAAGMLRTIIAGCAPLDTTLNDRARPRPDADHLVAVIVRRTNEPDSAFSSLPTAVNFSVEGTVIGDGREWTTVQLVPVVSESDIKGLADSLGVSEPQSTYVLGVRASMDGLTTTKDSTT